MIRLFQITVLPVTASLPKIKVVGSVFSDMSIASVSAEKKFIFLVGPVKISLIMNNKKQNSTTFINKLKIDPDHGWSRSWATLIQTITSSRKPSFSRK